jgi:hypothetical protein
MNIDIGGIYSIGIDLIMFVVIYSVLEYLAKKYIDTLVI